MVIKLFSKIQPGFLAILMAVSFMVGINSLSVLKAAPVDPTNDVCSNLVDPNHPPSICQKSTKKDPVTGEDGIITVISQTIVYITGIIAVIVIIIGGIKYLLSAGDTNGTAGAKNTILYALVGLVIAVFGQVIVSFVLSKL